jgi:hypothetical protein
LAHLFNYKIEIGNDFTLFESLDRLKTSEISCSLFAFQCGQPREDFLGIDALDFYRPFG